MSKGTFLKRGELEKVTFQNVSYFAWQQGYKFKAQSMLLIQAVSYFKNLIEFGETIRNEVPFADQNLTGREETVHL